MPDTTVRTDSRSPLHIHQTAADVGNMVGVGMGQAANFIRIAFHNADTLMGKVVEVRGTWWLVELQEPPGDRKIWLNSNYIMSIGPFD